MRKQTGIRLPDLAQRQLEALCQSTGMNQSAVMVTAIDRMYREMYREERRTMKAQDARQIKVGDYIEWEHSPQTYKVIEVNEKEIIAKSPWGSELRTDFSQIKKVEKPALWDKLENW